jgi:UDP-glucose 4-epimerase
VTVVWVIGSNGLLGSALKRALNFREIGLFNPTERFHWDSEAELTVQLKSAVKEFASLVGRDNKWQIYWAAGVGTMSSTETELATETQTLSTMLNLVESEPNLILGEGCFAFSSSAGAIYAGSDDDIISEHTLVAPTTAYAKEKLKQERLISAFALNDGDGKVAVLLARISTLYGSGQAIGKQQGLIAHIARCILRGQSINIYVPFDTIRDYITADDAATEIVTTLFAISGKLGVSIKIIASEKPTTIAEIISVFRRISRQRLRIVSSASKLSNIYNHRIQFKSMTIPVNGPASRTSLLIGISQVIAAERLAFTRSCR